MFEIDWMGLQNGSDIRGYALDDKSGKTINLTRDTVKTIGRAFTKWLAKRKNKDASQLQIAVGHDSRLSADNLTNAVIDGMRDLGADVFNCGLASTPAMFMSTVTKGYEFDGSIMLTASHLPFDRNGLKFFTGDGGLDKKDITEILTYCQEIQHKEVMEGASKRGGVSKLDFVSVYAEGLVTRIQEETKKERPLEGFHIVVDAGNGAGGFFVDKVLKPLGAHTKGSQFLDPDGNFPNHAPNPEDKKAMAAIQKAVLDNRADLGIIFDTDVDRAGAVDRNGVEINRNRIIALIAAIIIEEKPGSTIVTDSITSEGLKKFIEEDLGGVHHRFKRGYRNVINEAIRLNKEGVYTPLAIETSGHGALIENYFLDDGAYLIAKILIKMAKLKEENRSIDQLIEGLQEPKEEGEFRFNIKVDDFKSYGQAVINDLEAFSRKEDGFLVEPVNYEGIRVKCGKGYGEGWFLLRLSLHDPLLPLNIESEVEGGLIQIASKLYDFFKAYDQLDLSSLERFLEK